ncbi:MAG: hypothetical protein R3C10_18980 [Pirellulales bacterium]
MARHLHGAGICWQVHSFKQGVTMASEKPVTSGPFYVFPDGFGNFEDFAMLLLEHIVCLRAADEEDDLERFRQELSELDVLIAELSTPFEAATRNADWQGLYDINGFEWGPYTGARKWRRSGHELMYRLAEKTREVLAEVVSAHSINPVVHPCGAPDATWFEPGAPEWKREYRCEHDLCEWLCESFTDNDLVWLREKIEAERAQMNGRDVTPEPIDWHGEGGNVLGAILAELYVIAESVLPSCDNDDSVNARSFRDAIRSLRRIYDCISASDNISDAYADIWLGNETVSFCGTPGESWLDAVLKLGDKVAQAPDSESSGWPLGQADLEDFRDCCRDNLDAFTPTEIERAQCEVSRMANKDVVERLSGKKFTTKLSADALRLVPTCHAWCHRCSAWTQTAGDRRQDRMVEST